MNNIDDVRDFEASLKQRLSRFKENLRDQLAPHHLTLAETRVHRVLIPMVGVYTPGWQALPAASWEFVELVTEQGLTATGEWPIDLDDDAESCIDRLRQEPGRNLLDLELEEPLFMAWWDLVGQVLEQPLHVLWAHLFERGFEPPQSVPMAAYTWMRFPDADGNNAVTYETWPEHAAERARTGFPAIKVSMTSYQPEDHIDLVHRIRAAGGDHTAIRIDTHGTWHYQEARRILPAVEDCNLEYIEQPVNFLLPQCYYPNGEKPPVRADPGGYQDEYYFPFDRHPQVGFWLAVSEANLENGCLHVLPGSQRESVHEPVPDRRPNANVGYVEIVDHDTRASVPVCMQPGDLLVFHSRLMHCSRDNESQEPRTAMVYHVAERGTVDGTPHTLVNDWMPIGGDGSGNA